MLPGHNTLIERIAAGFQGRTWSMVGGSDAHTLRRVGRTWTEAPGRTREEFLAALAAGRTKPGGLHGGTVVLSGDVYGVVLRYLASLAGSGPRDHAGLDRALCIIWSALLVPCQFMPFTLAAWAKAREGREVARAFEALQGSLRAGNADPRPLGQVEQA